MSEHPALPGILAEIEECVGRDIAVRVAIELGGTELHVPSRAWLECHPDHRLVQLLSPAVAARLAEGLAGASEYVPLARRACAVWLAAQGCDTAEIARRLGIARPVARRYARGG